MPPTTTTMAPTGCQTPFPQPDGTTAKNHEAHETSTPITVNDASRPHGGDTLAHKGHETGLMADLRVPTIGGGTGPNRWNVEGSSASNATYDRSATRVILQALRKQPLFAVAYFNDPILVAEGLCRSMTGHDNHLHIEVRPPPWQDPPG